LKTKALTAMLEGKGFIDSSLIAWELRAIRQKAKPGWMSRAFFPLNSIMADSEKSSANYLGELKRL
jgi:hypothetical protein